MTLLLDPMVIDDRRRVAAGSLRPLADALAAELQPLIAQGPRIPAEKARLSRDGGRTWPAYRDVETSAGEYSYPTAVQMDDGMIHLFYTHERRTIAHAHQSPAAVSSGR